MASRPVDLKDPIVLSGILIGAGLPFVFAALTMLSVDRGARSIITEVFERALAGAYNKRRRTPPKVVTPESRAFVSGVGTRNMIALDITPIVVESLKAASIIVPAILTYKSLHSAGKSKRRPRRADKKNGDGDGGGIVQLRAQRILTGAEFDAGNVAQVDRFSLIAIFQDNLAEFLLGHKAAARIHR